MNLLLTNNCEQEADFPSYSLVPLTADDILGIQARAALFTSLKADFPDMRRMTFDAWGLGIATCEDIVGADIPSGDCNEVGEDVVADEESITYNDVTQMMIDEDSVIFRFSEHHTDFYYYSAEVPLSMLQVAA